MSSVVEIYNGYVLKYVGDAVIAFFALGLIDTLHMTKRARCAKWMINVVEVRNKPNIKQV